MPDISKFLANLADPKIRAQMAQYLAAQGLEPPPPEEQDRFLEQIGKGPAGVLQALTPGINPMGGGTGLANLIITPADVQSSAQPLGELTQKAMMEMLGRIANGK